MNDLRHISTHAYVTPNYVRTRNEPWISRKRRHRWSKMLFAKILVAILMLTSVLCGFGVKGRNRVATNQRRGRRRHNPYAVPSSFDFSETVSEDVAYDEVEVSSYCRETVAHHEEYVRAMTHAPSSSTKVILAAPYNVCFQWRIQKFWKGGGGRQFISSVLIYRKCAQRNICRLHGKKRLIEKNMSQ